MLSPLPTQYNVKNQVKLHLLVFNIVSSGLDFQMKSLGQVAPKFSDLVTSTNFPVAKKFRLKISTVRTILLLLYISARQGKILYLYAVVFTSGVCAKAPKVQICSNLMSLIVWISVEKWNVRNIIICLINSKRSHLWCQMVNLFCSVLQAKALSWAVFNQNLCVKFWITTQFKVPCRFFCLMLCNFELFYSSLLLWGMLSSW